MTKEQRSGCPINLSLEVLGDRWSLIILRDMIYGGKRHYRELLNQSLEGISSNILADRLKSMIDIGLLTNADDPTHKQKSIYSLTEMSISLVPVLAQLGAWGRRYMPATPELCIRAQLLEAGGPEMWEQLMKELRFTHLGKSTRHSGPTVAQQLQIAYEKALTKKIRKR